MYDQKIINFYCSLILCLTFTDNLMVDFQSYLREQSALLSIYTETSLWKKSNKSNP